MRESRVEVKGEHLGEEEWGEGEEETGEGVLRSRMVLGVRVGGDGKGREMDCF